MTKRSLSSFLHRRRCCRRSDVGGDNGRSVTELRSRLFESGSVPPDEQHPRTFPNQFIRHGTPKPAATAANDKAAPSKTKIHQ